MSDKIKALLDKARKRPAYEAEGKELAASELPAPHGSARVLVNLGDLYASPCSVCGCNGYYGMATRSGPEGCVEAVKSGQVFCEKHLPNDELRHSAPAKDSNNTKNL